MSRRRLVLSLAIGLVVFATLSSDKVAIAQQSGSSPSIADRLRSLRGGWGNQSKEKSRANRSQNASQNASRNGPMPPSPIPSSTRQAKLGIAPLPRVNSRQLLPRDLSGASRTTTARGPRTAIRPDASRPSPTARRSPMAGRQYDFDPEELRRDLVDSAGKSIADRLSKKEPQEKAENKTPVPEQREELSANALVLEEPAERVAAAPKPLTAEVERASETEAEDLFETALEPLTLEPQALKPLSQGIANRSAPVFDETADAQNSVDQQRVKVAGERAFSTAPQEPLLSDSSSTPSEPMPIEPKASLRPNREEFARDGFSQEGPFNNDFVPAIGENVLVKNRMPMISSNLTGPSHILIGREATFKVHLANQSDVQANEVVAQIQIPEWADVVDTVATNGIIQRAEDSRVPNTYRWQLNQLAARSSETLEVKLIPRSSRPLELGINWTYAPVISRTVVEVQEPKLRMHVSGPDEVLFDKPQLYRLTLTNPGTGVAEQVKIELLPPGGGEQSVSTHMVGNLQPGTSKSVEVELTAREPGKLFVKATASALGGISAEAFKELFCRKPELEIDWRGPEQKYAGTMATYFFRVRNPGTAAAEDVTVSVQMPAGVEFQSASDGQIFDAANRTVDWRVGSLRPGDDYYMELKCSVNTAGKNQFDVSASTEAGDLVDAKVIETQVIALADLKLEIIDPIGPIPVGEEAIYEIRVRNRGTNTAEEVNIVALFSEGIEAKTVEGAQYSIADGRVTFRTIEKLAAGREVVLRIRAKASRPGTHVFRAEVLCRDLEIKLAAEETTRFFQDEVYGGSQTTPAHSADRSGPFGQSNDSRY